MCFARWTFAEGAQCLLCSFLLFASAVQIRVHKRLLARPLSRNLFEGNWQLQSQLAKVVMALTVLMLMLLKMMMVMVTMIVMMMINVFHELTIEIAHNFESPFML